MAKAWAATAEITPMPPRTDKTMPTMFIRALTVTSVVALAPDDADEFTDAGLGVGAAVGAEAGGSLGGGADIL